MIAVLPLFTTASCMCRTILLATRQSCMKAVFMKPTLKILSTILVCFGGPSQIGSPAEEVFVNVEKENGRVTYQVKTVIGQNGFCFRGFTTPGDSISPIWKKSAEGLVLVGIAGSALGP